MQQPTPADVEFAASVANHIMVMRDYSYPDIDEGRLIASTNSIAFVEDHFNAAWKRIGMSEKAATIQAQKINNNVGPNDIVGVFNAVDSPLPKKPMDVPPIVHGPSYLITVDANGERTKVPVSAGRSSTIITDRIGAFLTGSLLDGIVESSVMPLHQYWATSVFYVRGVHVKRQDLVRFLRNKRGGAHSKKLVAVEDAGRRFAHLLKAVQTLENEYHIDERNPLVMQLLAINQEITTCEDVKAFESRVESLRINRRRR